MKINNRIIELENKLNELKKIKELFPDIEIHKDRWEKERYSSSLALKKVDKTLFYHSCGCCPDAVLYVGPYLEVDGIEIYTNPERFIIGQKHAYGFGEEPDDDWEERLKNAGLTDTIIEQTRKFFKENPIEDCDDEDYDYEDK